MKLKLMTQKLQKKHIGHEIEVPTRTVKRNQKESNFFKTKIVSNKEINRDQCGFRAKNNYGLGRRKNILRLLGHKRERLSKEATKTHNVISIT